MIRFLYKATVEIGFLSHNSRPTLALGQLLLPTRSLRRSARPTGPTPNALRLLAVVFCADDYCDDNVNLFVSLRAGRLLSYCQILLIR